MKLYVDNWLSLRGGDRGKRGRRGMRNLANSYGWLKVWRFRLGMGWMVCFHDIQDLGYDSMGCNRTAFCLCRGMFIGFACIPAIIPIP